ncbi:MAG TPA: type IV pilus assembly protein PilM [Egibacteraceae bacterium]|nr:type IV pilus assembly protein PilM [Egibacteraceae bacterium]
MPAAIGLDIGSSTVRAVQISPSGRGHATLERVAQAPLAPGAVHDGEVVDPELVAMALRELWAAGGFKGRRVALGVSNQQVVVRQVDLPYLPDRELRQSLQFQVDEAIPIPVEQAILDYHPLETLTAEDGRQISRILLVAAQREMVQRLVEAVSRARLEPVLVDLDAFAMLRSLAPESSRGLLDEPDGELLIDLGSVVTNLVVHSQGQPRFVRILLMGGDAITDELEHTLGVDRDEAERLKAETGLLEPMELLEAHQAARIISERAGRFLDEVRGSVDYYAAQPDAVPVRRAVLTGGASRLRGLAERLEDALGMPVERGHPMQELRIGTVGLSHAELVDLQPDLAVAIGLALGAAE